MRHETCLACRLPGAVDLNVRQMILVAESIASAEFMHHHHLMHCSGCGGWWFDDVVIGGLGIPVPSRRDTELCPCDEALTQYTQSAIHVAEPENRCACMKAKVDEFSIRIPLPAGKPGSGAMRHHETVPREEAVRDISAHVGGQDAFIVSVPSDALADITQRLRKLAGSTCYLDYGAPAVARFRSPHLPEAMAVARSQPPGTAIAVFIVPKTVPAVHLSKLLGSQLHGVDIPADGSQDLLMIHSRDRMDWPALLVDAIGEHDPQFAVQLYANDLRNQS